MTPRWNEFLDMGNEELIDIVHNILLKIFMLILTTKSLYKLIVIRH